MGRRVVEDDTHTGTAETAFEVDAGPAEPHGAPAVLHPAGGADLVQDGRAVDAVAQATSSTRQPGDANACGAAVPASVKTAAPMVSNAMGRFIEPPGFRSPEVL